MEQGGKREPGRESGTEARGDPASGSAAAAGAASTPEAEPAARQADPEGNRAWLTQLDRRVSTRTWAGGAALVLALAAAIVAIVLAVDARENSASEGDVKRLERQLAEVAETAGATADVEQSVDSLATRLNEVEDQLGGLSSAESGLENQLEVIEDDIEDLRQQISGLDSGSSSGGDSGGTGPGSSG